MAKLTPDRILQIGIGFWASKTLLTAVELGLFSELAKQPLDREGVEKRLGLHPRASSDFLDALVAMQLLRRTGTKYANTAETAAFLDSAKPTYIGGILEMFSRRLYRFWDDLAEGLRTGQPQNEAKTGATDLFESLYADPARLRGFLQAMTGLSMGAAVAIARKFPWARYKSFVDVGTAQGALPVRVALAHRHVTGIGFDLPVVAPIFKEYVRSFKLERRLRFHGGDFFKDSLPGADVVIMGHLLHDWDVTAKKALLEKAYAAVPQGGACLVFDAVIDDERRKNVFGLLMSLNMLIETRGGLTTPAPTAAAG